MAFVTFNDVKIMREYLKKKMYFKNSKLRICESSEIDCIMKENIG